MTGTGVASTMVNPYLQHVLHCSPAIRSSCVMMKPDLLSVGAMHLPPCCKLADGGLKPLNTEWGFIMAAYLPQLPT